MLKRIKIISLLILTLAVQTGFSQTRGIKFYQLHESFKTVEDSIDRKINPTNTLIYKTCNEHRSFYFIKDSLQWTGYFIKNLVIDDLNPPTLTDISGNEYKPFLTELYVFNADSLYSELTNGDIYKVQQISEDSIQIQLSYKTKNKNTITVESLPQKSHDCNGTIIIYGKENKNVTYRGALIEEKRLHIIPTLKIFYNTMQVLINATKSYY